uniref:Long-chain-fatty-acid--CoA ligase n=1 Tax=uncultured bacterium esnapd14 TaxID=1366594 RepID=S5TMS5_9BACT|nr:long-chain-fatty-acid--CoA ligase [uncultured bacterium esnapd14]
MTTAAAAPLSFGQHRMWSMGQLADGSVTNLVMAVRLTGPLNLPALAQACTDVVARHHVLRTTIELRDGEPIQVLTPAARVPLHLVDLPEAGVEAVLRAEAARPLDLTHPPLVRVTVLRTATRQHIAVVAMHHAATDGWSLGRLATEISLLYQAYLTGRQAPLRDQPVVQFAQYATRERARRWDDEPAPWLDGVDDPAAAALPIGRPRLLDWAREARLWTASLPPSLTNGLADLRRREGGTLFMLVLAAWTCLMHRLDGRETVLAATLASGRVRAELEPSIGYFANVLPLGARVHSGMPFRELWRQIRDRCAIAYEHQDTPFEVIARRWPGASPISVLCVAQPPTPELSLPGLQTEPVDVPHASPHFDLTIEFREQAGALRFGLQYDASVLDGETVAVLGGYLRAILQAVTVDPDVACGQIRLGEARTLDSTGTRPGLSLHEAFERQCARTPDRVALRHGERCWTYRALNARANRLARALIARGVRIEDRVAVCLPRGHDAVVAILATLKAGAAFVPIDPSYPQARIAHMLADADVKMVLDDLSGLGSGYAATNPGMTVAPDNLAYVMYTSGTTGRPKGVLGLHGATMHRLEWMWQRYPFGPDERSCQRTPLSFVDSVWEILGPLLAGVTADILDPQAVAEPDLLVDALHLAGSTRIVVVPSLLRALLDTVPGIGARLPAMTTWITSGERLAPDLARRFHRLMPGRRLLNLYGCTEVSADATGAQIPADAEIVTIGQPIAGASATVVDPAGRPVPPLVAGELVIGGPLVARGYHRAAAATAARFRPGPAGGRVYHTGDLARVRADGQIEYLGRIDDQVKVRGVRIEPAEVEAALLGFPSVRQAAVAAHADALVAYVCLDEGCELGELRAHCRGLLPAAFVPSMFIRVDELPLGPSGKIDRRRLPAVTPHGTPGRPPTGTTEILVAQAFTETLPIPARSVDDDFFALGGQSITATALLHRLKQRTGAPIELRDLFAAPSVAALARLLDDRSGQAAPADEFELISRPEAWHDPFPLTEVQQAYWIGRNTELVLGNVATHAYFEVDAVGLDITRLETAIRALVERHAALRTVVIESGEQQVLQHVPPYHLAVQDARGDDAVLSRVRETMSHQVLAADRWPLFDIRASLLGQDRVRLHVSIDALLADAYSVQLLTSELARLYHTPQTRMPPLRLTFRDAVLAETDARTQPSYERSLTYWRERLTGLPVGPELPLSRSPESLPQPRFRRWAHKLDSGLWRSMVERAAAAGVTPSAAVLAAFAEVLTAWSRHPHYTVMLTLFNRRGDHPDLYRIVGDFTSVTPLEIDHREQNSFTGRARTVQGRMWTDLDHRSVSGITVLREWTRRRSGRPGLLTPVVFTSNLGLPDNTGDVGLGELGYGVTQTPQAYLDHQVAEAPDGLILHWDVVADLFPPGLVDAMFNAYVELLTALADGTRMWDEPVRQLLPPEQVSRRARVNATAAPLTDATLPAMFAASSARNPQAPAVITAHGTLSYWELAGRAGAVARSLAQRDVGRGDLVGVAAPKGWEQAAAVLGVTAAGAAYMPLDPDLPAGRRRLLEQQTGMRAVLTAADIEQSDSATLPQHPSATDLAYVIFTSGSTGTPKGVMIDHRGAVNTVADINRRFGIGPDDRVLGLSALSFDLSVYDLFGIWAAGGAVVLPDPQRLRDPKHWLQLLRQTGVTVWNTVPALLDLAVDYAETAGSPGLSELRVVMLSGDWIPVGLPDRLRRMAPGAQVISLGGATEASIWSVYHRIGEVDPAWPSIPYGRPLANQRVYVLDNHFEPRPDWVPGDLYLAGIGLALGYLGDPARTAEQFVNHPHTGERLYRTGDIARARPDGELEFLGREDNQVKISGFRIELGEIEAAMRAVPGVSACAATAVGPRTGDRRLAAFFVGEASEDDMRSALREALPGYLVPTSMRRLDSLPLTAQGKVDRSALAALAETTAPQPTAVPAPDELVSWLAAIWARVLGVESVGPDDNFFHLGGTSLVAVRLLNRLEAELGRKVALDRLYEAPTVRELASAIGRAHAAAEGPAPLRPDPGRRHEPFPLTTIQEAYWLGRRSSMTLGGVSTHSYVELDVSGLDADALEGAVNRLVARHDALRTIVRPDGTQRVLEQVPSFTVTRSPSHEGLDVIRQRMSHRVYDTSRWPLFDLAVSRLDGDVSRLHVSVDLIVADALSFHILQQELLACYHDHATRLPELGCTFRDYVCAVEAARTAPSRRAAERYWRARIAGLPAAPPLPLACQLTELARPRFTRLETHLDVGDVARLREHGSARNLTPSGVLCAGYADVLAMWSQTGRFTINLTTFNRLPLHPDIDAVVGDFTSTTLLAVDATGDTFTARAQALQQQIFRDLEHREFGGVEVLRLIRSDPARRAEAFAPVVFTSTLLPDGGATRPEAPAWPAKVAYSVSQTPQVLLDFQVYEHSGGLVLTWDHVAEAFPDGMVTEMFDAYGRILQSLVTDGGYWEVGPGWKR